MRMREIEDLLPSVLIYAPKCPDLTAISKLREAARRFCMVTRVWRESDTMTIETPAAEGVSTIPDAAIVAIEAARLDDYALDPKTVGWLDANVPGWDRYEEDVAPARYVTQLTENTVTVAPKATGTLTLRLILKPSLSAYTVPDILVDNYATEIGKGAAAEILKMPDPDFQNPQLAIALGREFEDALQSGKFAAQRGQQQARTRTAGRYF